MTWEPGDNIVIKVCYLISVKYFWPESQPLTLCSTNWTTNEVADQVFTWHKAVYRCSLSFNNYNLNSLWLPSSGPYDKSQVCINILLIKLLVNILKALAMRTFKSSFLEIPDIFSHPKRKLINWPQDATVFYCSNSYTVLVPKLASA